MTEKLLNGSNVVSRLKNMGCERMAKGMAVHRLGNVQSANRGSDSPLENGFVEVMASYNPIVRIDRTVF